MNKKHVYILAIESSCDDTSAAVSKDGAIVSNIIANQAIHTQYGGVVPELASRAHQANIVPVVDAALKEAKIELDQLSAIAFTKGPGLIGSLLVGCSFAKSLSWSLQIPLIEVNHMQAHVLGNFAHRSGREFQAPEFPFLCLTVSGGHTQIVLVSDIFNMEVIGETKDDAAGEAFDKTAKLLGLPYPGGPFIDKYAQLGDPSKFKFPIPSIPGLDFSFSGFKTAVLYFLQLQTKTNPNFITENLNDICASVQYTIIKILVDKLTLASKQTRIKTIAIAGGVSANSGLRNAVKDNHEWNIYIPEFEFCTDNAAMIAITGHYKYLKGNFTDLSDAPTARFTF